MQLKATFDDGTVTTYDIAPTADVTAADLQDVYKNLPDRQKSGSSDIVIYCSDATVGSGFYSYSNIRVNVRGDLEKIAQTALVDLLVEVEPFFVATHKITMK